MTTQAEKDALKIELLQNYPEVLTTDEMTTLYEVRGFGAGLCVVSRKSDGALGSLEFTHMPRFYYNFILHEN